MRTVVRKIKIFTLAVVTIQDSVYLSVIMSLLTDFNSDISVMWSETLDLLQDHIYQDQT